jgi:hypothetical protein
MAEKKSFLLRIDPELWSSLQAWAANDLRSINGQIEYVLKEAVRQRERKGGTKVVPANEPPSQETGLKEDQDENLKSRGEGV